MHPWASSEAQRQTVLLHSSFSFSLYTTIERRAGLDPSQCWSYSLSSYKKMVQGKAFRNMQIRGWKFGCRKWKSRGGWPQNAVTCTVPICFLFPSPRNQHGRLLLICRSHRFHLPWRPWAAMHQMEWSRLPKPSRTKKIRPVVPSRVYRVCHYRKLLGYR